LILYSGLRIFKNSIPKIIWNNNSRIEELDVGNKKKRTICPVSPIEAKTRIAKGYRLKTN
jgi:hypothetical protein